MKSLSTAFKMTRRLCRFYTTVEGCKKGKDCQDSHGFVEPKKLHKKFDPVMNKNLSVGVGRNVSKKAQKGLAPVKSDNIEEWTDIDDCVKDTRKEAEKFGTIKNLNVVWDRYPDFDHTNSFIIDGSLSKMSHPSNGIFIPEYNFENDNINFEEDKTLLNLKDYLEILSDEKLDNAQDFLKSNTFTDKTEDNLKNIFQELKIENLE
eukprot:gene11995-5395_t